MRPWSISPMKCRPATCVPHSTSSIGPGFSSPKARFTLPSLTLGLEQTDECSRQRALVGTFLRRITAPFFLVLEREVHLHPRAPGSGGYVPRPRRLCACRRGAGDGRILRVARHGNYRSALRAVADPED